MHNITKKETKKTFSDKIAESLHFIFRDKEYSFWLVTSFHNFFYIFIFLSIILFEKETFTFKISVLLFFLFFLFFCYSGEDPIINLERIILKDNSWSGFYEILELFDIKKTKKNIHFAFFSLTFFIYYIILFKIFIKQKLLDRLY
jgi:hypothetical protein